MTPQVKISALFRYLFLYSLLGYSAFLATEGRLDASGAVLGGCVGLYSLQKNEDGQPEQDEVLDELRLRLRETQHEVNFYKHKLVESDLRIQYQDIVNQNVVDINHLKQENHGFAITVSQEQSDNLFKANKISCLESENIRLRDQIAKMEKDRLLSMKRSVIQGMDSAKSLDIPVTEADSNIATVDS